MDLLSDEALLKQLGYTVTNGTMRKIEKVIENTPGIAHIKKHLLQLNDALRAHDSFVAISNSEDYFKIKNEAKNEEERNEVNRKVEKWGEKYKISLKKVEGKETYYILGHKLKEPVT
ncbi:MAG: hypothetical protein B6D59_01565 [Campylobacteraceae bacterium 4484_4]|nr:MAG: hypothetical protein B6D59_01565 [Campylobacteraceae bacterium 4484_4]